MNDQLRQPQQPQQPTLKTFGAPPAAASGLRRLAPWMLMGATGGTAIAVVMYGTQLFFPYHYRPAVVAGTAAGETMRAEMEAMKEVKIDLERRLADANHQAATKAQADLAVTTSVVQERTNSLAPVTDMAGVADIVCAGAKIVSMFTEPHGWGNQSGDQFYFMAQKTGKASCGMGNVIRQANTANILDAVRTVTDARGMQMRNGAVAIDAAPAPVAARPVPAAAPPRALPTTLAEVFAIDTPSRQWPWPYVMKAREFIKTLPADMQKQFFANLSEDDGWDVLVDRVQAYQALPDAPLATAAPVQPAPVAPVQVISAHPVEAKPAKPVPAAPSRFSVVQQGLLRVYSYRMPGEVLRQIAAGLDLSHGYPEAWYARVASYQDAHKG